MAVTGEGQRSTRCIPFGCQRLLAPPLPTWSPLPHFFPFASLLSTLLLLPAPRCDNSYVATCEVHVFERCTLKGVGGARIDTCASTPADCSAHLTESAGVAARFTSGPGEPFRLFLLRSGFMKYIFEHQTIFNTNISLLQDRPRDVFHL